MNCNTSTQVYVFFPVCFILRLCFSLCLHSCNAAVAMLQTLGAWARTKDAFQNEGSRHQGPRQPGSRHTILAPCFFVYDRVDMSKLGDSRRL